jgi:hypothetical protein
MAAIVRVGAILKRLLPMMSGVFAGDGSRTVSCFAVVPPNDRHSPAMLLRKRTSFVSMMRS